MKKNGNKYPRYFINPDFINNIWYAVVFSSKSVPIAILKTGEEFNGVCWDSHHWNYWVEERQWIEVKEHELPFYL